MPQSQSRVVGSGFTVFRWQGQSVAFLEAFQDDGQRPVAQVEPVQPLDEPYPIEWAVPRAMVGGSFMCRIKELWAKPVWQHLAGFAQANDLLDVWAAMTAMSSPLTAQTIIKPPGATYYRVKTYHNVVVSSIDDSEQVSIGQMTIDRDIRCMYTKATRAIVAATA